MAAVLALLLLPSQALAGDALNGPATLFHDDGGKRAEGHFHDGHLVGRWIGYHPNGQVAASGEAAGSRYGQNSFAPVRTGPWREFAPDGTLLLEGSYRADRLEGPAIRYYESGTRRTQGQFRDGRLAGRWTGYHPDGQVAATGEAAGSRHGENSFTPVRTGPWREFAPDGTLLLEGSYRADRLEGPAVRYYESGTRRTEGHFRDGHLAGRWTGYHPDGQVAATGEAAGSRHGENSFTPVRTGLWLFYERDGTLRDARRYRDGTESGAAIAWSTDPDTGITRIVDGDGGRQFALDRGGRLSELHDPLRDGTLIALTDPETGETQVIRRLDDGSILRLSGRLEADGDGRLHFAAVQEDGNRVALSREPDGRQTLAVDAPDGHAALLSVAPDGQGRLTGADLDGPRGSIAVEGDVSAHPDRPWLCGRDSDGLACRPDAASAVLDGTRPPIWLETEDAAGHRRLTGLAPDGRLVVQDGLGGMSQRRLLPDGGSETIHARLDGSHTIVRRDAAGQVTGMESHTLRPTGQAAEPGRRYYEEVLGGTDWDALPEPSRNRQAWTERAQARTAEERLLRELRIEEQEREQALEVARRERAAESGRERFAAFQAEEEAHRRAGAERRAMEERHAARLAARTRAEELEQARRAAAAAGDLEEVRRLEYLHDAHHDATLSLFEPTEAERREQERRQALRDRVNREVNGLRANLAAGELARAEKLAETRQALADNGALRLMLTSAQALDGVEREKQSAIRMMANAAATLEAIDQVAARGGLDAEQSEFLSQRRAMALEQYAGAVRHNRNMNAIVGTALAFDAVTSLAPVGRAGSAAVAAGRWATGTAAAAATSAAGRLLPSAARDGATRIASAATGAGTRLADAAPTRALSEGGRRAFATATSTLEGVVANAAARTGAATRHALGDAAVDAASHAAASAADAGRTLAEWGVRDVRAAARDLHARWASESASPTIRLGPEASAPTVRLGAEATAPTVRLGPEAHAPTLRLGPEASAPTVRLGRDAHAPSAQSTGLDAAALARGRSAAATARREAEAEARRMLAAGQEIPAAKGQRLRDAIAVDNLQTALERRMAEARAAGVAEPELAAAILDPGFHTAPLVGREVAIRNVEERILARTGFEILPAMEAIPIRRLAVRALRGTAGPEEVATLRRVLAELPPGLPTARGSDPFDALARQGVMNHHDGFQPLLADVELEALRRLADAAGLR